MKLTDTGVDANIKLKFLTLAIIVNVSPTTGFLGTKVISFI